MARLQACLILGQNILLGTQNCLDLCPPYVEFLRKFTITCVWIILCIVYSLSLSVPLTVAGLGHFLALIP